jgi:4-hydroxythreonine-4-phosphate dehydrogenase
MKPRLALTIGDPAGIGPEITVKALRQPALHEQARLLVIGSAQVIEDAARSHGNGMKFPLLDEATLHGEWTSSPDSIPLYRVGDLAPSDYRLGEAAARTGRDSVAYVETAAALGKQGLLDGMVTAPINKEAMRAAGVNYPGHTEILGAALESHVETMFVVDRLRIFFLTRHLSLRRAIDAISAEGLLGILDHAAEVLAELGVETPRVAVAGLNPHAGDGGIFGDEEIEILAPAIRVARERGLDVTGPVGADSVFHQALEGRFDCVISLYHDQGHIAAKTYDFNRTVSVTTGLPLIRTSVDHGTAFDIAGKGIADPTNMIEAVRVAAEMAGKRLRRGKG